MKYHRKCTTKRIEKSYVYTSFIKLLLFCPDDTSLNEAWNDRRWTIYGLRSRQPAHKTANPPGKQTNECRENVWEPEKQYKLQIGPSFFFLSIQHAFIKPLWKTKTKTGNTLRKVRDLIKLWLGEIVFTLKLINRIKERCNFYTHHLHNNAKKRSKLSTNHHVEPAFLRYRKRIMIVI